MYPRPPRAATLAPADFIVEYIAQTRGWFYTMHVLSCALFDRPAFRNVICHGVVLDAEGPRQAGEELTGEVGATVTEEVGGDAEVGEPLEDGVGGRGGVGGLGRGQHDVLGEHVHDREDVGVAFRGVIRG